MKPSSLERQLWLWLGDCEEGKPVTEGCNAQGLGPDQVVPFLQYGVRESSEAREAGDVDQSPSSKLQ